MPHHYFVVTATCLQNTYQLLGNNTIGSSRLMQDFLPKERKDKRFIEFKTRAEQKLHEAGIEVILDVVYNHTAEGNHMVPTLSSGVLIIHHT